MIEQRRKKIGILFGCFAWMLAGMAAFHQQAQAASATVSFSSAENTVAVGEEMNLEITILADEPINSIEGYLTYDSKKLEYLTGTEGMTGSNGILKLSDTITEEDIKTKSYQMTFRARKKGSCLIEFSEQPVIYEADTEEPMSVSYEDISVQVTKATILSNNASLDSLQISPGTLEPSFAKNIREYKVFLGSQVHGLTVSAIPSDAEATVSVRGNENLTAGENLVLVTVEAPSGKTKKYRIYVQKEAEEQTVTDNGEPKKETSDKEPDEDTSSLSETQKKTTVSKDKFKITQKNGTVILKNSTKYTLATPAEDVKIPSGYIKTKLILYGVTVNAYTLEHDLENDFVLMYAKKDGEEPQFYQYDREEKTMQRFRDTADSSGGTKIVVGDKDKALSVDEYNKKVQQLSLFVGISAALVALFAIGMLNFAIKYYSCKAGKDGKADDFLH